MRLKEHLEYAARQARPTNAERIPVLHLITAIGVELDFVTSQRKGCAQRRLAVRQVFYFRDAHHRYRNVWHLFWIVAVDGRDASQLRDYEEHRSAIAPHKSGLIPLDIEAITTSRNRSGIRLHLFTSNGSPVILAVCVDHVRSLHSIAHLCGWCDELISNSVAVAWNRRNRQSGVCVGR